MTTGSLQKAWITGRNMFGARTKPVAGTWSRSIISKVLERIEVPVKTVIDVGAHTGEFARAVAAETPAATILCFEPLSSCQPFLERVAQQHGRCRVFDCALGDANRTAVIHRNAFTPCSSLLQALPLHTRAFPHSFHTDDEVVQLRRMDDVLQGIPLEPTILLKIDVQGYEDQVLLGAQQTLNSVSAVFIETTLSPLYKGQKLQFEIEKFLLQKGFYRAADFGDIKHMLTGKVLQQDLLFLRAA